MRTPPDMSGAGQPGTETGLPTDAAPPARDRPAVRPVVLGPGEGHARWWGRGSRATVKLTAAETSGALGMTLIEAVAGERAPRHIHTREDEIFILADGATFVTLGENSRLLEAGGVLFMPRGIPHSYEVRTPSANLYVITLPGGFEQFFLNAGYRVGERSTPAPEDWDVSRTHRIAEEIGLGLQWCEQRADEGG